MIELLSLFSSARARLLIFVIFAWAAPAAAHEMRPAIADMSFDADRASVSIALNLEAAIAGIGPQHEDTDDAPGARNYNVLRASDPAVLRTAFDQFAPEFLARMTMRAGDETLRLELGNLVIPDTGDTDLARESRLTVSASLPSGAKAVTFGWDANLGPLILRAPGESADAPYSAYLTDGAQSDPIAVRGAAERGFFAVVSDYLVLGYTHILPKGHDHILFVVGLFLFSAQLRPLLWQVTSFTVAHTVTLALGITGTVSISPSIVEPLIAASIVYVCVENLFSERMAIWRPAVVFGFGLLHGLGFAGVLGEIGMPPAQFVTALLSFNIGVELGQLTVIALCFLAVGLWFRHAPWYRNRITIPASLVIAVIGAYWFVERVFLT